MKTLEHPLNTPSVGPKNILNKKISPTSVKIGRKQKLIITLICYLSCWQFWWCHCSLASFVLGYILCSHVPCHPLLSFSKSWLEVYPSIDSLKSFERKKSGLWVTSQERPNSFDLWFMCNIFVIHPTNSVVAKEVQRILYLSCIESLG